MTLAASYNNPEMTMVKVLFAALVLIAGVGVAEAGAPLDWNWMQRSSCWTLLHMRTMPPLAPGRGNTAADLADAKDFTEAKKASCRDVADPKKVCIIDFIGGADPGHPNKRLCE